MLTYGFWLGALNVHVITIKVIITFNYKWIKECSKFSYTFSLRNNPITMASNVIFKATLLASLFLPLLSHLAIADEFKADPVPSYTICNITTDPSYCRHVLPKQDAKVHDFGRFSIKKSLFQAQNLSNFTKSYLLDHSTLSQGTVRAIQECIFLSELNVD